MACPPTHKFDRFTRAVVLHVCAPSLIWSDSPPARLGPPRGPRTHLVAGQQLAPPVRLGHVVDGQAQVVVAVFEKQDVGLVNQTTPELSLHLHHLLQEERGGNAILLSQSQG